MLRYFFPAHGPQDELKGKLLEMGICEVLIPLTNSQSSEVQGNSAAALGNLSSKGTLLGTPLSDTSNRHVDGRSEQDDYSAFNDVWDTPEGGMHQYLYRFLTSPDATFQHIAVWTIVQLLESGDPQLISNIKNSTLLLPNIRNLANSGASSPSESVDSRHSHNQMYDDETDTGDGQGEIQLLSRRIVEFVDGEEGMISSSVAASHMQPGSSVNSSRDDELRRSVREAFAPGSHR